jgi:hypothetical protein
MTSAHRKDDAPPSTHGLLVPAWVGPLFVGLAILLIPWTIWLGSTLPARHLSRHWDLAWAGFDSLLAVALLGTAVAAIRRSTWLVPMATVTATLLVCDAWFDVVTAAHGRQLMVAVGQAMVLELPLAAACVWIAVDAATSLRRTRPGPR